MKSISVQYFALLREEAGVERENLSVPFKTYGELYSHLQEKHNFKLSVDMIQVAVDDEFAQLHHEIAEGARIVFIPPVAGG
ncbi:MAG: molybdopterin converting factor subunit 1 [Rhizobacter sp.]|nr:molybdopterin converting factor subunit 1 [Bacteriovorax sp.]